jgi:hypothetical protein
MPSSTITNLTNFYLVNLTSLSGPGFVSGSSSGLRQPLVVPPMRPGGQYRKIDLPNMFFAGRGPLKKVVQLRSSIQLNSEMKYMAT